MSKFPWDQLLDCLAEAPGSVVPIVGSELLQTSNGGSAPVAFADRLVPHCTQWLRDYHPELDLSNLSSLGAQASGAHRAGIDFGPAIHSAHRAVMAEMGDGALPEPLQLLAAISALPFFITTTTDGLLARALRLQPTQVLSTQLDKAVDLPLGWQPRQAPTLFHLFGRVAAGTSGALTDEDVLEYFAHLHDKGRPVRLLSHLRQSHLLFLGNQFPDWLARVLLRLLRDDRFLGGRRTTFDAVADPEVRNKEQPLVGFLRAFSPLTRIYDEGDAASFIRELHRRWQTRCGPAPTPPPSLDGEGHEPPPPMIEPAIFISYASENLVAAESLAAALGSRKLPVWFDRRQLQGGDRFAHKIEQNIRRSRLFIPLLSRQTEARQRGWFRNEWTLANELLKAVAPGLTFVMPVVIDDLPAYDSEDLREYFTVRGREPQVLTCGEGVPSAGQLDEFVNKYRAAIRAAAVA